MLNFLNWGLAVWEKGSFKIFRCVPIENHVTPPTLAWPPSIKQSYVSGKEEFKRYFYIRLKYVKPMTSLTGYLWPEEDNFNNQTLHFTCIIIGFHAYPFKTATCFGKLGNGNFRTSHLHFFRTWTKDKIHLIRKTSTCCALALCEVWLKSIE